MTVLRKPWWSGVLMLGLAGGCSGEPQPPVIGANQVQNGSFESGLSGWWNDTDSEGGTAAASSEAADHGSLGLVLHKGFGGWGSMVGQETPPHAAGQTFQIRARFKGVAGGERVTFSFHGQGFELTAEPRWQTVSRLLLLPETSDNTSLLIGVTSDGSTVHLDDVSCAPATVERGDADEAEDNLLRNGSFESDLGMWNFWTDSEGEGTTSPEARQSGYAGLVLRKGPSGNGAAVKQPLPDPVRAGEEYRIEAHLRGTRGGERVLLCLQVNYEPWDGPCVQVTAEKDWEHISRTLTVDAVHDDQRMGVLVSLLTEGTVMVDDVIVVRLKP